MSEKAPMPPWWVEEIEVNGKPWRYEVLGGKRSDPKLVCFIYADFADGWSNAKELADLIVQRTKQ